MIVFLQKLIQFRRRFIKSPQTSSKTTQILSNGKQKLSQATPLLGFMDVEIQTTKRIQLMRLAFKVILKQMLHANFVNPQSFLALNKQNHCMTLSENIMQTRYTLRQILSFLRRFSHCSQNYIDFQQLFTTIVFNRLRRQNYNSWLRHMKQLK